MQENHHRYIQEAIKEAQIAFDNGEVPVGAIIVNNDRIIARAHNQVELLKDPTAHAEVIAITQATSSLENWRLSDCTIYVTIEPCPMCAGALINSRIKKIVFGARDPRWGACGSVFNIVQDKRLNHQIEIIEGICQDECASLLKEFFKKRRGDE
jgi:tRNA(adenine34) deaminase